VGTRTGVKKPRALVIDGNNLIYRCYYGMPYLSTPDGEVIHGTFGTINRVREAIKLFTPHKVYVCWDGSQAFKSWRHDFFPPYKSNRQSADPDKTTVRDSVNRQITIAMVLLDLLRVPQVRCPRVEGDDAISVVVNKACRDGYRPVILSPDHDFMQLVDQDVSVYDPMKVLWARLDTFEECTEMSSPEQYLDYMIVNGDTGDGVPMVKGLSGEKRWEKWKAQIDLPLSMMLESNDAFQNNCPIGMRELFVPRYEELHRNWKLLDLKHARSVVRMDVNEFWPPHEHHDFHMGRFLEYASGLAFRSVVMDSDEWRTVFEAYHRRAK
jgi:5'-3' exonuclease-like protein